MNLSRDSVLALQRHFLGALRAPARTWLEPVLSPRLVFLGGAIRSGVLDLGSVSSPGAERTRIRVCNRGAEQIDVRLSDAPAWLTARWISAEGDTVHIDGGGPGAVLELLVVHDTEQEFHGALQFTFANHIEELPVHMLARRSHPIAQFDFNGSPEPRPFDFGGGEQAYGLSVVNASSIPLVVTIADLPAGLTFEVDGRHRNGPIAGPFFERTAPFAVKLRLQLFGGSGGVVRLHTNDPRPEMQDIALRFTASNVSPEARVPLSLPRTTSPVRPEVMLVLIALLFFTLLFVIARGF
jgi:hypothetical protein